MVRPFVGIDRMFQKAEAQVKKLDAILDKIKEKGYENLTPEEKEFLYKASKK